MSNGKKELLGPNPGPDFALRESDAQEMKRAMKGVTTGRAAGMAHQAVANLKKRKKVSKKR